jgi:beta-fructofuranosidase
VSPELEVHCDKAGTKGFPISVDATSKTLALGYLKVPFELNTNEEVRLRNFLDRYLIEVFANDRQSAVARHTYDPQNLSIVVFSRGADAIIREINAWKMKSTWTKR